MNDELKPCPFCGAKAIMDDILVRCVRCPPSKIPKAWNRRTVQPEVKALLRAAHELQDWYLITHKGPMWERLRAAIDALRGTYTF